MVRASAIYIGEFVHDVYIKENIFKSNILDFITDLIKRENIDVYNFFPPWFF